MCCALTTFSTVDYGDRYPITHLGRFVAGSWMVIYVAIITILIAGIATTLAIAFLVEFDMGHKNYSIALTPKNTLTTKVNEKLLSIEMQLRFKQMQENWFKPPSNN